MAILLCKSNAEKINVQYILNDVINFVNRKRRLARQSLVYLGFVNKLMKN